MTLSGPNLVSVDVPKTAIEAPIVLLAGNPNTGKTTLFNALSGETARVGNYPGITVERRSSSIDVHIRNGSRSKATLVDLPGAYSLSARSLEERITLEAILGLGSNPKPNLLVLVVDAGQLARNFYLLLQILELSIPVVVAVNMIDEVKTPPSMAELSAQLGVTCVATSARKKQGIAELRAAIDQALVSSKPARLALKYPESLLSGLPIVEEQLPPHWNLSKDRLQPLALWALTSIGDDELRDIPKDLRVACENLRKQRHDHDIDMEIVQTRYAWIENCLRKVNPTDHHTPKHLVSERIDRVLLHPVAGFLVFALVTIVLFQALFVGADPLIHFVESVVSFTQSSLERTLPAGWPRDLLTKGIIGGVGNVVVFLPQIALLFAIIGFLEDSGYMSRVAFLIDRVMRMLGLHGRAFVPMISGFACAVPAIMATRTLERQRDRLLTMLVVPLMTCSARLPVYTLIIGALFPPKRLGGWLPVQGALMVGLYGFAIVATLGAAWVLGNTVVKAHRVPLILELPPYRMPHLRSIGRMVMSRSSDFLREAGTIILLCTIVLWALLSFPRVPVVASSPPGASVTMASSKVATQTAGVAPTQPEAPRAVKTKADIERSPGAYLGRALEPVLKPLGFDWKIGVGLVGSFAAREVFVSTMALVYGISDGDADVDVPLRERMRDERRKDGTRPYSPLVGASLLAFFAIACQCSSTLAVIRRETRTWRWPLFLFAYTGILAWLTSFAIYQGGRLLGLS